MPPGPVAPGVKVPEARRRAARAAREKLERWTSGLGCRQCVIVEPADSVPGALLRCVRGATPDLVVMATHGREGLAQMFLGSIAESVIRHGRTPVLCVREPEHGAALPFRRILVPTDLSAADGPSPRRHVARAFDSEVLALHVARVGDRSLVGVTAAVEAEVPSEAELLDFLWPEFATTRIAARVELGSAADQIIQTASTEKADLIVMSTHGHDSLRDRLLGSQTGGSRPGPVPGARRLRRGRRRRATFPRRPSSRRSPSARSRRPPWPCASPSPRGTLRDRWRRRPSWVFATWQYWQLVAA